MRTILSSDPPPPGAASAKAQAAVARTVTPRSAAGILARWLSRNAFLCLASSFAVMYSPSPIFNCAILAGFFAAAPERFLLIAITSALTSFIFAAQGAPLWIVLAGYLAIWPLRRRLLHDGAVTSMLLAGGGLLLWRVVSTPFFLGSQPFMVIAEASLCAMLGYFYLQIIYSLQTSRKHDLGQRLSLMVLFFYPLLLGMGNLTVFGLLARPMLVLGMVWLLSYTQDAAWGALSGLLGGIMLWQDPLSSFYWSATLGLLGALIGFTSEFGRWTSMLIYAAGLVACNGYILSQGGSAYIFESVVAFLMLSLVPEQMLGKITNRAKVFVHQLKPGPSVYSSERAALGRLTEMTELIAEMASFFQPPLAPTQPSDGRASGIALLLQERCCATCPKSSSCLARSADLFEAVALCKMSNEEPPAQLKVLLQQFTEFCYRPDMLFQEATHLVDLYRMNDYWQSNWNECNSLLNHQLHYTADMLQQVVRAVPKGSSLAPTQRRYRLECQRMQRASFPEAICGDSILCSEIGRYAVLAISDGMGSGTSANHESKSAVRLLERLLHLDYPPQQALQMINTMLLARSAGERFATLDVFILDLTNGEGDIYKSGAAPSFLLRDGLVHEIAGNGLPAGALPDLEVEKRHLPLRNDDVILLISDGMLSLKSEESPAADVVGALENAADEPLSAVLERLMLIADRENQNSLPDDRTVLLAKVRSRNPA